MRSAMAAGQSSGKEPKEQDQKRGPTEGERTPDAPTPQEQQQSPKPDGQQPDQQGQKPDDRGQNPPTGRNEPSAPRVDEPGPAVNPTDDAERWGMLPARVQQIFRNQITDDLPVQYRDWIDSYYRRMNRSH